MYCENMERGMNMAYYVGIDGGGTKTKVIVIDQSENIIHEGTSGPSSIDTVSRGETLLAFKEALRGFYHDFPDASFDAVFVGLGGIVSLEDCHYVENIVKNLHGVSEKTLIRARNDMENALYSGLLFYEGIALICGTGMVAFGKNKEGITHKAGGWGYREGDLGSSYDLGMRALRHVIKAFDGRDIKTEFSNEIAQVIGMEKMEDFFHIINEKYLERTWIAGLAPLVTKYALLHDEVAIKMIHAATEELAIAVYAVKKRLNIEKPVLVIVGSLGHAKGYQELLHEKIKALIPDISIIGPKVDPSVAAALMAKRLI